MTQTYDVVVVGAGHAGCEAAHACARMGLKTALIAMNTDLIAQMSCNPAIGGIAKGHLVREIDALGGLMGVVTDAVGIQFRLLNTSRGPAVWSPRAQCDKKLYRTHMKVVLEREPRIFLIQGEVVELLLTQEPKPRAHGVRLRDGRTLRGEAVVVTTGTFLNGLAHIGQQRAECGRSGESAAKALGDQMRGLDIGWVRLKTGTPPRLDGRTIDWDRMEPQPGDPVPTPFSFLTTKIDRPQIECHITHTTEETHRAIRENVARSPLYSGEIEGLGPRYCPSIEDKIVKFPDKNRHQLFLEPEGLDTNEVYVNGMSTSMPLDVQAAMIATVPGLERAEMIRPGYAIEYDAFDARYLTAALEVRAISHLFLAGQINGTSGYEEAAGQGLLAGINAACKVTGRDPVILPRSQSYLGVMVDDLTTKGADEPYRLFTSRAEHRLHLRVDNADDRLTPLAIRLGLATAERVAAFERKQEEMTRIRQALKALRREGIVAEDWLRRPASRIADLAIPDTSFHALTTVETEVKYAGYLAQQERQVARLLEADGRPIPQDFGYDAIPGLSREIREKLLAVRPSSLGQASRIPGVTPSAIAILDCYLTLASKG